MAAMENGFSLVKGVGENILVFTGGEPLLKNGS